MMGKIVGHFLFTLMRYSCFLFFSFLVVLSYGSWQG